MGKLPGANCTVVPSLTVAKVLYGTAIPVMVRRGSPSGPAASTANVFEVKRIMTLIPLVCFLVVVVVVRTFLCLQILDSLRSPI